MMDRPKLPPSGQPESTLHCRSHSARELCLTVQEEMIPVFFPLLQRGFELEAMVGCSLRYLLIDQWGLDPEYVSKKLSTIFLDGRPVDDIDSAMIDDRGSLALSAAMPGLVGATMRRGGQLASFRSSITYRDEYEKRALFEGSIHVKLFNLVMNDLGPLFLRKGIVVEASELADFLERQPVSFQKGFKEAILDGKEVCTGIMEGVRSIGNESIRLCVSPGSKNALPDEESRGCKG